MRLRGDHLADLRGLAAGRVHDRVAGGDGGIGPAHAGAALDAAEVLGARDDLLADVASLLEAHRAEPVQVEHLRQEGIGRVLADARDAGADVRETPGAVVGPSYTVLARRRDRCDGQVRPRDDEAGMAARRPGDRGLLEHRGVVDAGGTRPCRGPIRDGARAGDARHPELAAHVVDPRVRAQDEHAQAREQLRDEPALADEQVSATGRIGEEAERREHPALGRAPGGEPGCRRADLADVGGELALEEGERIGARGPQHGEGAEPGDGVTGEHRAGSAGVRRYGRRRVVTGDGFGRVHRRSAHRSACAEPAPWREGPASIVVPASALSTSTFACDLAHAMKNADRIQVERIHRRAVAGY